MDVNNKYSGFEKMIQDKLGNHEYSYDHNDWLNFEKKLPKGKSHFNLSRNLFRYLIFPAAVIVPVFFILYFSGVFDTNQINNDTGSKTALTSDNVNPADNTSNDLTNTTNSNSNSNSVSDNNKSNDLSANNNDKTNDQTTDNSNTLNDDNSDTKTTNDNSQNSSNNSQTDNDKPSGGLITSDVIEGCAPLKVKFTPLISSGSITYLWAFGDGKTSSVAEPSHVYIKAGSYTVTLIVKSSDGKTKKKLEYSNKIEVKSVPLASFEYSVDDETDEYSFKDNSKEAFVWTWNFGDKTSSNEMNPGHTYTQDGNYNVKLIVMNTAGCTDTISKKIDVKLKELYYCPTGFTPNGDGLNDYFGPIGDRMNPEGYKMQIFDQSGILVFETSDLDILWDGKKYQTNTEAAQGLYFWKISMKDKNNNLKEATGYLTLMR